MIMNENREDFIFLRLLSACNSDGRYKFRGSDPFSYSRARDILLRAFEAISLSRRDYCLHSQRGGLDASAAVNALIKDRLFKIHM